MCGLSHFMAQNNLTDSKSSIFPLAAIANFFISLFLMCLGNDDR